MPPAPALAVSALLPGNGLFLIEEAWNALSEGGTHCLTVLVNGWLDTKKRV